MAALLVGIGPAKAWENVPGNKRADGCVGRDGAVWGDREALAESALRCWPAPVVEK